jgi:hypothetical protein
MEVRGNPFLGIPNPYQKVRTGQECHFRMLHIVGLPTGHHDPEGSERTLGEQLSEGLHSHGQSLELVA